MMSFVPWGKGTPSTPSCCIECQLLHQSVNESFEQLNCPTDAAVAAALWRLVRRPRLGLPRVHPTPLPGRRPGQRIACTAGCTAGRARLRHQLVILSVGRLHGLGGRARGRRGKLRGLGLGRRLVFLASRCASSVLAAGASSGAGSGVEGSASSRSASSSCSCWRRRRVPQLGQRSAWRIGTKACCFARSRVPRQRTASRSQFPRGLVGTEARDRSTEPNNQSPCNHTVGTICVLSFVLFRAHLHSSVL
jgi:hypothetical protein